MSDRAYSLGQIPRVGDLVDLPPHDDDDDDREAWQAPPAAREIRVTRSYGAARLCAVEDTANGERAVIAFQANGHYWIVREFADHVADDDERL